VYILRTVGFILFEKVADPHYEELTDATWDEKVAVVCLIACVAGLGCFPIWASNVINGAVGNVLGVINM
jgi:NADH-quinone oxidoreductase subunit M